MSLKQPKQGKKLLRLFIKILIELPNKQKQDRK